MFESEYRLKKAATLKYDAPATPRLVKKATGEYAEIMVEAARELNVPVVHSPALTEALASLPIDTEVPEDLFEMVAVVLSWAYWLKSEDPN